MSNLTLHQNQNNSLLNDEKKMQLLKDVFFKGSTNEEFELFVHACARSGLDPFMKQIYPVKRWDPTLNRLAMTIQTGIDGYRLIAERTGRYAPGREPVFEYDKDGKLFKATAYVKKLTKDGTWHEVAAPALYEEYVQTKGEKSGGGPTAMWVKMPHSQLSKCAESLALRKAFPGECSGIYTKEEMEQSVVSNMDSAKNQIGASKESLQIELISPTQAKELQDIFDRCEPSYVNQVITHLKRSSAEIEGIDDIPLSLFERIKLAAIKKASEYYDKMNEGAEFEEIGDA